ncbi:MAG: hypothetical protein EBU84_17020 [Actinobacteria bacterium]|nr:hypothetical protein [Actinomycetota bacterium]
MDTFGSNIYNGAAILKVFIISSHKTYDNLNAAKHDARELARLIPNGKGLVVKQNPDDFAAWKNKLVRWAKNYAWLSKAQPDAWEDVIGGRYIQFPIVRGFQYTDAYGKPSTASGLQVYESWNPFINSLEWTVALVGGSRPYGGTVKSFSDLSSLVRKVQSKARFSSKKNPSLGDYFRAGKKTALELAQQALKEAQEAADQAAKAAEAAKAERTVDSPEKALRVLAKKEGFELVRKNSGTSAMYKLGMRVATDTDPWERHNAWGGLSLKAAKEAILEVSDGDECDYPTDKASVRDFLAGINAVLAKTPKENGKARPNPNEKTVLGHTVRKTKTGYTIVPYNLHLPSMKAVTTYLKAHIAQEKK